MSKVYKVPKLIILIEGSGRKLGDGVKRWSCSFIWYSRASLEIQSGGQSDPDEFGRPATAFPIGNCQNQSQLFSVHINQFYMHDTGALQRVRHSVSAWVKLELCLFRFIEQLLQLVHIRVSSTFRQMRVGTNEQSL